MERRQYTPTKVSQYTHITNANTSGRSPIERTRTAAAPEYSTRHEYTRQEYTRPEYTTKSIGPQEMDIIKEYEALKMQVRQMESQSRQLSNEVEKLRYEKNINENKYMQKVSYEEETIAQFQKEKNYQMELLKIKNDEDTNKLKRQYEYKLDDLQRQLRNKDYHNRQFREKNSYIELKINELHKGIEILQCEHIKFKEANNVVADHLNKEQFNRKRLTSITEELEIQKRQMEEEIHVLLDIEADKSRTVNTLESQLRNAEADERSLHDKLTVLTDNFANLEEHISIMKERLVSTDCRNQQLEQQLRSAEYQLADKDSAVLSQKDLEVRLRKDLEVEQQRQMRREKQIQELIAENQRLLGEININRQRLQEVSLVPGMEA